MKNTYTEVRTWLDEYADWAKLGLTEVGMTNAYCKGKYLAYKHPNLELPSMYYFRGCTGSIWLRRCFLSLNFINQGIESVLGSDFKIKEHCDIYDLKQIKPNSTILNIDSAPGTSAIYDYQLSRDFIWTKKTLIKPQDYEIIKIVNTKIEPNLDKNAIHEKESCCEQIMKYENKTWDEMQNEVKKLLPNIIPSVYTLADKHRFFIKKRF